MQEIPFENFTALWLSDEPMPTVTVIIPTFNRAGTLRNAIDSALAQDFDDFEVIVVDDGSTDDTWAILHAYPQIHVVRQNHQGVSAARNAGILRAGGSFVAFLDSDDLWFPKKLSAQLAFFHENPDAVICQTEEIWVRNGARVNPGKRHRKGSGMIFERCLELCMVSPSAVMMKQCLFDQTGLFDESFPVCEDYDLWLRVSCRFPIHLIETPLVVKRGGHPDQLSRRHSHDRYRIRALTKILASDLLSAGQYAMALSVLEKKCRIYAQGCLKRGRTEEAGDILRLPQRFGGDVGNRGPDEPVLTGQ